MTPCTVCLARGIVFVGVIDVGCERMWVPLCLRCVRRRDAEILSLVRERQAEWDRLQGKFVTT